MDTKIPMLTNMGRFLRHVFSMLHFSKKKQRPMADRPFTSSKEYWERRYSKGGTSGTGSYGVLARFKADIINDLLITYSINTAIEFGCGDGNQLNLIRYPSYIGYDVSQTSIRKCEQLFSGDNSKEFRHGSVHHGEKSDLALSLDVIYHLVEDEVFERHMTTLFGSARKLVVIYSSNENNSGNEAHHVRHRKFTDWIKQNIPEWSLIKTIPNRHPYKGDGATGSSADFFIYTQHSANN